jgi:hypothetical protein
MATEWSFPVVTLPANPHRSLPVFAIPPNWKNGVTETLAWLTDVMSSETAVEQRRSLRRFPRRSFEYAFMRQGTARARIDNFLAGVGKRDCLVPLWHEQFTLQGEPSAGGLVQFPVDSLIMREYALDDLVLVTSMDANSWALLTVTAHDIPNDRIELSAVANVGTWPRGARIVPVRRAKMLDSVTLENVSDRVGSTRMRFMLQDADDRFTPSWGYCSPLWRNKPDRSTPVSVDFNRSDYTLDFSSGVIDITDPGDRAQISQSMSLKFFGRAHLWAFRSFLYNARGRARRFYVPTFTNDVEVIGDIGGIYFDAKPNGFNDYFLGPQEARSIVGIEFKDGRPAVYRTIVTIAPIQSTSAPFRPEAERFVFDQDLPPILKREIERINFVAPSRFDQDTIEIFHPVSDSAVAASSVVMRSSIVEGMPPIECWTTSRPYPVVSVDGMDVDAVIVGASLYESLIQLRDDLAVNASLAQGTLTTIFSYVQYDMGVDEIVADMDVLSGVLTTIFSYVQYDMGVDEIVADMDVLSGVLRRIVIIYTPEPDSILSDVTLIQGTLS